MPCLDPPNELGSLGGQLDVELTWCALLRDGGVWVMIDLLVC